MIVDKAIKLTRSVAANLFGWRTERKIVVIESDDWGSLRMQSDKSYNKLKAAGVDVDSGDSERYNRFDTIETCEDLVALFEVLTKYRDIHENKVRITPMFLVANPNFQKIQQDRFGNYYYESLPETLTRLPGRSGVVDLYIRGIELGIFLPEFHGREHLHVSEWMRSLRAGNREVLTAFNEECWGFTNHHPWGFQYQAAFDLVAESDVDDQRAIIIDGLDLFKKVFGYTAKCFVPPNGPFSRRLEPVSAERGIKFIGTAKLHKEPVGYGKTINRFHYLGQRNESGQTYLTRNCFFEPSSPGKDWQDSCLSDIRNAFAFRKPAIISTHRVNYVGARDERNRSNGLRQLDGLLNRMITTWPDIEFMTSRQLGEQISNEAN